MGITFENSPKNTSIYLPDSFTSLTYRNRKHVRKLMTCTSNNDNENWQH